MIAITENDSNNFSWPAVSQIWALMTLFCTMTDLVAYSTPANTQKSEKKRKFEIRINGSERHEA